MGHGAKCQREKMNLTIDVDHGKLQPNEISKGSKMPETIPISKFKATCLRLLGNVKKTGKSILITRKGEPIALVTPPPPKPEIWLGSMADTVKITGDIVAPVIDAEEWEAIKD